MKELVVLVDEDNNEIGTMPKREVHNAHTLLHRGFSVFLFNSQGDLLLQQRALTKKTWPGVWSNSCCGHPSPKESTEGAVARRLQQELGLTAIDYHLILPRYRYRIERDGIRENEICPVYVGLTDHTPRPNPEEVAAIKYLPWTKFLETAAADPKAFSEWSIEEAQQLTDHKEFEKLWQAWYNKSP